MKTTYWAGLCMFNSWCLLGTQKGRVNEADEHMNIKLLCWALFYKKNKWAFDLLVALNAKWALLPWALALLNHLIIWALNCLDFDSFVTMGFLKLSVC